MRALVLLSWLALLPALVPAADAADWTTPAEAAHYRSTPDGAATRAYLQRLADAAPGTLRLARFGTTPQGRPLDVVVASNGGTFTPAAARAAGKAVVLVQAGIHAGEIEGKDAGLALLRDLVIRHKYPHLLDRVVLLYVPVFNVDGHARTGPYNRINQNGPAAMGFRATAQNLNLNRDYVKADAPEMRAWLALWNAWLPDLLIDVHTTDGADYRYDLTWYTEDPHKLDPAIDAWQRAALNAVLPRFERRGHLASPYLELKDGRDITKGIVNFGSGPRFSTGYAALQNRPALLIETHMLKDYATRVRASYDMVELMLERVAADPAALRDAVARADAATVARAARTDVRVPLAFKLAEPPTTITLKGFAFTQERSEISGDLWVHYDPRRPQTYTVPWWRDLAPEVSVAPPAAYLVPAEWSAAIERLDAHGIRYERLAKPLTLEADTWRMTHPEWATQPFESHLMLARFDIAPERTTVTLAPGAVIVPLDQRAANVAIELLEPQAPDSLVAWGYFDAIFQQHEYAEPRVAEQLARDMLAKDPALRAAFEAKLRDNPAFAGNPAARLAWFYDRSPWKAVQRVGLYPVLRLDAAALAKARAAE
ncbi:MAG: M14 family metallopeptidase [Mizugakiibacter sp.]|uniref:M14 family metallopeptidase n=1 Tax=Mizugakiibacter sp. TaxID=1972610 RepID=UPI0031CB21BA|nr:M14 family metallopeptidase [Xanthomonadaceae bacterium]